MFSRIAFRAGPSQRFLAGVRTINTAPTTSSKAATTENSERDLVNFPRPKRLVESGKVRLGFVPEEWFQFFYKKTGVTGPYMFGVGLSTYLISKEIFILEHEYYTGLSIIIMLVFAYKKLGPTIGNYLDKEIDNLQTEWDEGRTLQIKSLEDAIKDEEKEQWRAEGQTLLLKAKRENVALQLEAAYRERIFKAYSEVKKRLDYQVEKENIQRRIAQKNLVEWVVQNVLKSITPQQEKDSLRKCISDLKTLAAK